LGPKCPWKWDPSIVIVQASGRAALVTWGMGAHTDVERSSTLLGGASDEQRPWPRRGGSDIMKRGRTRSEAAIAAKPAELVPDLSVAEPRVRLGDLLVHSGVVSRDALELVTPHTNG